jgi:hypothetical protein
LNRRLLVFPECSAAFYPESKFNHRHNEAMALDMILSKLRISKGLRQFSKKGICG